MRFKDTEIRVSRDPKDRYVELSNARTAETIVEWYGNEVLRAISEGHLDPKDWHGSAYRYAFDHGLIKRGPSRNPVRDDFDDDDSNLFGGRTFARGDTTWETPSTRRAGISIGSALESDEGWISEVDGEPKWFKSRTAAETHAKRYGGKVYPGLKKNPSSSLPSDEDGNEFFTRRIGDADVFLRPMPSQDWVYEGQILLPDGSSWKFKELAAPPIEHGRRSEDDPDLLDEMACSAVSFGSYDSDEIAAATEWAMDDRGAYEVIRPNPSGLTAKGERMYEHVKAHYSGPRAKEIAARTVYARSTQGVPGLRKKPR